MSDQKFYCNRCRDTGVVRWVFDKRNWATLPCSCCLGDAVVRENRKKEGES